MPSRYIKRKRVKRKSSKVVSIPRVAVASRITVELPYSYTWQATSTVAVKHTYRLNSVFDPYYTAGGHQPRYYDQYTAMYEKYRVLRTHVSIVACNGLPDTGTAVPAAMIMSPGTVLPGITDIERGDELPGSKYIMLPVRGGTQKMSHTYDIATYVGTDNARKQIDVTTDPIDALYLFILCDSAINSGGVDLTFHIQLNYVVEFSNFKEVGVS